MLAMIAGVSARRGHHRQAPSALLPGAAIGNRGRPIDAKVRDEGCGVSESRPADEVAVHS